MTLKTIGLALGAAACAAVATASVGAAQQTPPKAPAAKAGQTQPKTASATSGRGSGSTTRAAAADSNFTVSINVDYYNNNELQNPERKPIIVVATCNATREGKELNGWVGANTPTNFQKMVASESGTERASVTFVVPWLGWYKVETKAMSGAGPTVPFMTCEATGWLVY